MAYEDDPALETWGWFSVAPKAASELRLSEHLAELPVGGVVLDIGAGPGVSIAAATFVERQDLTIISVDPGFGLPGVEDTMPADRELGISYFSPTQQALLRGQDTWYAQLLIGHAENLPVEDSSVDLAVSYSAVPVYSPDTLDAIVSECSRVQKVGSVALHGPMPKIIFEKWKETLQKAMAAKLVASFSSRVEVIEMANGDHVDAYFTEIVR